MESVLNKLQFILTKYEKKRLAFLFLGALFLAVLETFSIGIIIPIMDLFINQDKIQASTTLKWFYRFIGAQNNINFLMLLIITAFVLFVLKSLYSIFIRYAQKDIIKDIFVRITTKVLSSYLNKPYLFHLENNSAILFKNATTAVSQFTSYFILCLVSIISDTVILLAIFCLLVVLYPVVTSLLGFILFIVTVFINLFLKKRISSYSSQLMKASEHIFKFGLEALHAVKEIKIYGTQSFFIDRYSKASNEAADSEAKFSVAYSLPRYILDIALWTSVLIALSVSIYFHKSPTELIPMMTVFTLATVRILPSVHNIYSNFNSIKYYSYNLDIVYEILKEDIPEKVLQGIDSKEAGFSGVSQLIHLENIKFRFKTASKPIFDKLSVIIPEQKTIAFVGETGAGKSTLIDILTGLLSPANGTLFYGKSAINPSNVSEYRRKISYVPQNVFLMDDTLEANITFGMPQNKIIQEHLRNIIQISQLENLVDKLPSKIKTVVGEKGIRLSGGERQRIAIARALYRNPEILILDEATSALDRNTEAKLYNAIRNSKKECTIIFVTHRVNTLEHADYIYVMDSGKIIDHGSYKALLENSEVFRKIIHQAAPSADETSEQE